MHMGHVDPDAMPGGVVIHSYECMLRMSDHLITFRP